MYSIVICGSGTSISNAIGYYKFKDYNDGRIKLTISEEEVATVYYVGNHLFVHIAYIEYS